MPPFRTFEIIAFAAALATAGSLPAVATPSTSRGQVSVAQLLEMLDNASAEKAAREVLVAYLAGVGEAAGAVVGRGEKSGLVRCKSRFILSDAHVRRALQKAAVKKPEETAATPIIVQDMVDRAECRLATR